MIRNSPLSTPGQNFCSEQLETKLTECVVRLILDKLNHTCTSSALKKFPHFPSVKISINVYVIDGINNASVVKMGETSFGKDPSINRKKTASSARPASSLGRSPTTVGCNASEAKTRVSDCFEKTGSSTERMTIKCLQERSSAERKVDDYGGHYTKNN